MSHSLGNFGRVGGSFDILERVYVSRLESNAGVPYRPLFFPLGFVFLAVHVGFTFVLQALIHND